MSSLRNRRARYGLLPLLQILALWVLVFSRSSFGQTAQTTEPHVVQASAYLVMDTETGRVLAEHNMHEKRYPASTTKTLTALLAIEKGDLNKRVIISENPPKVGESSIYLKAGEQLTLRELVEAAMIRSANDSCVAIAEAVAGSEEKFVEMMNMRARQLGAKNTHFTNSHGLHHPEHYTTAYDLALITREAMKHPVFNEIAQMRRATLTGNAQIGGKRVIRNRNKLLFRWDEADGIKTGTTRQAGGCLVASATRIDPATNRPWRLLSVVLQSNAKWADSTELLTREGFEKFVPTVVAHGGERLAEVAVEGGERLVQAVAAEEVRLPLLASEESALERRVHPLERAAPIEKGQTIAWLEWKLNGEKIASVPLVAEEAVDRSLIAKAVPALAGMMPSVPLARWSVYLFTVVGIGFLLAGWRVRKDEYNRRRKKRRRAAQYNAE